MHINSRIENVQHRPAQFMGRDYVVVPVVMVVEGVHDGSKGPLLYPAEEISASVENWNGMPVTVQHPRDEDGQLTKANEALEFIIGHISNPVWDDKLRAEAWIDVEKANAISTDIMGIIRGNGQLEVSTGLLSEDEVIKGDWKGELYEAIVRNIIPDHLALLPGEKGACSWADGCGIRMNQKGGGQMLFKNFDLGGFNRNVKNIPTSVLYAFLGNQLGEAAEWEGEFKTNEVSHSDIRGQIQNQINDKDTQTQWHFVKDVFDKHFVYSKEQDGHKTELFKQTYNLTASDEVELTGEPVEVIQKTEYITLTSNKEGMIMSDKKKKYCPEKVTALIANDNSSYVDKDKEWLETMEEDQLDRLIANVGISKETEKTLVTAAVEKAFDDAIKSGEMIKKDPDDKGKKKESPTADDFIANAPAEIQDVLRSGLDMHREKKIALVKQILANEHNKFTQEQLDAKSVGELVNIAALIPLKSVDGDGPMLSYEANSAAGGADKEEPMEMPAMKVEK